MNNSLSPSISMTNPMTDGQIRKAQDLLVSALRKHRKEFSKENVQTVLAQKGSLLQAELLSTFRKFVELSANMFMRTVLVKCVRTPQEAIDATGRVQYVNDVVVAEMPGGGDRNRRVTVTFFYVGRHLTDAELEQEYKVRGLMPADPYALAAAHEAYPDLADEHLNATHWKDGDGNWCYAVFGCDDQNRVVDIDRRGLHLWFPDCRFAGVPVKKSQNSST